ALRNMEFAALSEIPPCLHSNPTAKYPRFPFLIGEHPLLISKTVDGTAMVTNFRFCVCEETIVNIPLMMVGDLLVSEAAKRLRISCKDGSTYSCTFATTGDCQACTALLKEKTGMPQSLMDLFAYRFYAVAMHRRGLGANLTRLEEEHISLCQPVNPIFAYNFDKETERLQFDTSKQGAWRKSLANKNYELCPTYPKFHILPAAVDDDRLKASLDFRALKRFPSVVWRDKQTGMVLIRSSQPLSSFLGVSYFTNQADVSLIEEIVNACNRFLAIVDCRSLAGVWGNSFKGGGTEDEAIYKCNTVHLDLANIHNVRDSFNKLRLLCHAYVEGTFLKSLSSCMWPSYISALLRGANIVMELMHVMKRPVLVHCSDGWDRTSQIVSLSELMMDPYYRTLEGFQVLVEREWLHFGHKFGERGGHDPKCSDTNQISPIFLQFLDCVYQLTLQHPARFQFNEAYLIKLLQHSYACLFGNFLHNCQRERDACQLKTASVWALLRPEKVQFVNLLYKPSDQVLKAKCSEQDIVLWKSVYMGSSLHISQTDFHSEASPAAAGSRSDLAASGGMLRSKNNFAYTKHQPELSPSSTAGVENIILKESFRRPEDSQRPIMNSTNLCSSCKDCDSEIHCGFEGTTCRSCDLSLFNSLDFFKRNNFNSSGACAGNDVSLDTFPDKVEGKNLMSPSKSCYTNPLEFTISHESLLPAAAHTPSSPLLSLHVSSKKRDNHPAEKNDDFCESDLLSRLSGTAVGASQGLNSSATCPCSRPEAGDRRHVNGSEVIFRRLLQASVATSTTDTSDFSIGQPSQFLVATPTVKHQPRIKKHIDVDGLTMFCDERQDLVAELLSEKDSRILDLERQLSQARQKYIRMLKRCRGWQLQASLCGNLVSSKFVANYRMADSNRSQWSTLGSASDASCETLDESVRTVLPWVTDLTVTQCAGCAAQFGMSRWKHHCCYCVKSFCGECSTVLTRVAEFSKPEQFHKKPERICQCCHSQFLQLSPGAASDGRVPTLAADS
ncbi:unnamed protein product, partial [Candidula unifasciata]